MMLGVTAFITTDITPIPLLWVIPLSLYLFSFVVVFSRGQRTPDLIHKAMVAALPFMMATLSVTMLTDMRNPYWGLILLHLLGFFVVAMVLHGELARDRPPASHLTEFYLWVAVGGVLGGVFNALIAPVVFPGVVEYPLAIVLACLFWPGAVLARLLQQDEDRREPQHTTHRFLDPRRLDLALPLILGVAVVALGWGVGEIAEPNLSSAVFQLLIGVAAGLCLYFAYFTNRPIRFGLGIAALIVAGTVVLGLGEGVLYENRDFFGVRKVTGDEQYHALSHGDTNHGAEFFGDTTPPEPITYYHRTGPIGQLFDALPNEDVKSRVALLGLGTGSMACYNQPGQRWTFYEIDPLVENIARDPSLFTYLRDCPGESEVVLGDARLKIADAPDGEYGMIVGDAFSSDAIPVHLMTREAIDLYLKKLRSDGVLAIHISNRHLALEPVLGNLARDRGLVCYAQYDAQTEDIPGKFASNWVAMARRDADLGSVPSDGRWQPCASTNAADVWTDDFSNLLSTFVWN
jgi:hypothetical protein